MNNKIYQLFTALIVIFVLTSCQKAEQKDEIQKDGVLIHISHGTDNPHRLLMGLKMAATMAEAGKDVLVYCDIEAVRVLTANASNVSFAEFPTLHDILTHLQHLNVKVMACPTCMKVANIAPEDLRNGIIVANRDLFFSFTKGRIISIDY